MPTKDELELQKLEAEIAKLRTETVVLPKNLWDRAGEFVKVFAAILLTLVASVAAVTTWQITELKAKLAQREYDDAVRARTSAVAAKNAAEQQRKATLAARDAAERDRKAAEIERDAVSRDVAVLTANRQQRDADLHELKRRIEAARFALGRIISRTTPALATDLNAVSRSLQSPESIKTHVAPFAFIVPADASQTGDVSAIGESLKVKGFATYIRSPVTDSTAPSTAEIRYFKSADRAEAEGLLELLKPYLRDRGRIFYMEDSNIQRDRYFEVRLAPNVGLSEMPAPARYSCVGINDVGGSCSVTCADGYVAVCRNGTGASPPSCTCR